MAFRTVKAVVLAVALAESAAAAPVASEARLAQPGRPSVAMVAPVASGSGAENVAVLDLKPNNTSSGEASAISGFVRSAFVKAGVYNVVDKSNMDRILAEQAFQQSGCTDSECAVKLGKLLNVRKMVVGEYTVLGGIRFLSASLVDVETGRIERTSRVKGFELANADQAADTLAAELMGAAEAHSTRPEASLRAVAAGAATEAEAVQAAAREAARKEKERIKAERAAARALEPVDSRVARGRIGIGLNSPGIGVRALLWNRWMIEARGQYESEALAYGGRLYWYVFSYGRIYPYLGVEGDYVMAGSDAGYAFEGLVGLEYFIFNKLSMQFDFGPAYVDLTGGNISFHENVVRYVVNFGLTYYF